MKNPFQVLIPLAEKYMLIALISLWVLNVQAESFFLKPADVQQMTNDNLDYLLLDVREADYFQLAHIPGAVSLPVARTFAETGRTDKIGGLDYLQKLFSSVGVRHDLMVILYDNGEYIDAGRVFWILEMMGHQQVRVLDGGFAAWQAGGFMVSDMPKKALESRFYANVQPDKLSTKFSMRLASKGDHVSIVDARSHAEYNGEESISDRAGHIPGASNVPWNENFETVNGIALLKSKDELASLYSHLDKDKPVVTYCNKGKQSSFSYLVLRELGFKASHYDGSWFEWSRDKNLPIETTTSKKVFK